MDHYCTVRDSSFKTHCTQLCRSRASGPCCHREVCRPSAVIPSVRNIPQSGRGADTVAELLEPLYDVLRQYVLMPGKVHADDIPVPVQSQAVVKTERTGCGSTSVMTVMPGRRCPPAVWFAYSQDRKGIHPQNHLAGYSGVLQADTYGGYRALYTNPAE